MKRRLASAIAANALSSLGNLTLTVAVARQVGTSEFGEFALIILLYALVTGVLRSAVLESLLASRRDSESEQMAIVETGLYATVVGVVLLTVGSVLGSRYVMLLAVSLPGLVAFDFMRVLWLARDDSRRALLLDGVWAIMTACAAGLSIVGLIGPEATFAAWALAPSLIAAVAITKWLPLRMKVPKRQARPSYALDYLIGSGSTPAAMYFLAATAGPSVVGVIRAAATPMSPIHMIAGALRPLAIAWVGARSDSRPSANLKACVLTCLALTPYVFTVMFIPDSLGRALLGETWQRAKPLLLPLGLEAILGVANSIGFAGHRGLQAARRVILIRIVMAVLRVATILPAAALWGAAGAAWSLPISTLVGVTLWWISWHQIAADREQRDIACTAS